MTNPNYKFMNHEAMSNRSEVKNVKAGEVPALLGRLDENVEILSNKLSKLFDRISPVLIQTPEKPDSDGLDRPGANTQVGRSIINTNDKVLNLIGEVEDVISKVEL